MRHLVYLLLVANLVYLGWNVFEPDTATEPERRLPAIPASVSPLVLLQERAAEADSADAVSIVEDEATSHTDAVSVIEDEGTRHADAVSIIEEGDSSHADAAFIIEEEDTSHADAVSIIEEEDTSHADAVPIIEEEDASRADVVPIIEEEDTSRADVVPIIEEDVISPAVEVSIIEDEDSSRADAVSRIEDLNAEHPPGAGAAILCQALGPFLAVEDLQAVESRLVDLGLQPAQRGLESREVTGYWVYLSAMPQKEVKAVLATLKKHKDTEYFVGKTNFISLGTFKSMARAERRLKDIRDMGLDPVLQKRYTTQSHWWLDIQGDGSATAQLSAIAESRPELQLVEQACH